MSLIGNGFRENTLGKIFGGTSLNGANPSVHEYRGHLTARMRNQFAGEGDFSTSASVPDGCRHPVAWIMPQKPGGLSARNTITGAGTVSATAQSGYNIAAALTGAGGITGSAGLIVSIAATLIASGGISSAQVDALASMVATITGSGDVTATAAGLADLGAVLTGTGTVDASNTALMDIVATIRGYGDLTPEGLRDAVWDASLANYPTAGSAGLALATASSGGVDYNALALAVWEYATRTLTSGAPPTAEQIATAILAAAQLAPIHANTQLMNDADVIGTGEVGDAWRGVGVPP